MSGPSKSSRALTPGPLAPSLDRRRFFVGTAGTVTGLLATSALASERELRPADSATSVTAEQSHYVPQPCSGAKLTPVSSREGLAGLSTKSPALLIESMSEGVGRSGTFLFCSGDQARFVAADPGQGIFIAPSTDPTGRSGAWVRLFDGELDARWFGAVGDGIAEQEDVAINRAIKCAIAMASASIGLRVRIPNGRYRISTPIDTTGGGTGQVALLGDGEFATRILPQGDFAAIKMASSHVNCGQFSIEWPSAPPATIPPTRIGISMGDANHQFSYNELFNITVLNAYRSFAMNKLDNTIYGTTYLTTLRKLSSVGATDFGFYFDSKVGSTTLRLEQCYSKCGEKGNSFGKGFFFNNIADITLDGCAADSPCNSWIYAQNYNLLIVTDLAIEGGILNTDGATGIYLNGTVNDLRGIKLIQCHYDVRSKASVIFFGGNAHRNTVSGFIEQDPLESPGVNRHIISFNADSTWVYIPDQSVSYDRIFDNGYYSQLTYGGIRYSRTNAAPRHGVNATGDLVVCRTPAIGAASRFRCTSPGKPGVWVVDGQLGTLNSISGAPSFIGQMAIVGGIGYLATGTSSDQDWKRVTIG